MGYLGQIRRMCRRWPGRGSWVETPTSGLWYWAPATGAVCRVSNRTGLVEVAGGCRYVAEASHPVSEESLPMIGWRWAVHTKGETGEGRGV